MAEDQSNWYYDFFVQLWFLVAQHCALKIDWYHCVYTKLPMYVLKYQHKLTNIVTDSLIGHSNNYCAAPSSPAPNLQTTQLTYLAPHQPTYSLALLMLLIPVSWYFCLQIPPRDFVR